MLLFVKRSRAFLALGAACFILVLYFRYSLLPAFAEFSLPLLAPPSCPSVPPASFVPSPPRGSYQWRQLPIKHPVPSLARLPAELPSPIPKIQYDFKPSPPEVVETQRKRQEEVKKVFQRCWKSYRGNAWRKDELAPVSGSSKETFGGWGATLVDSMDTLKIMGLENEFRQAVEAATTIDFAPKKTGESINVFETTIRYLGGFLSAYDLTQCGDRRLLDKAVELGDMLYASFDTPNRMPVSRWSPRRAADGDEQLPTRGGIIAEIGSMSLEFTRLSQLTGDMRWFDAVQRVTNVFDEQQNRTKIPGLWPVGCNVLEANLTTGGTFSLGAMADSAYEYFPKMFALLRGIGPAPQYQKLYTQAIDAAIEHLVFRPMVPDNADILIAGQVETFGNTAMFKAEGQHLTCFVGGMFALGGRLFGNTTHIEYGRKLADGCVWAYRHSPLGIMPEVFQMSPCLSRGSCEWNETKWKEQANPKLPRGFTSITDYRYILRPEAIESVFYLYRITGDAKLQDAAWDMFLAVENHTHTRFGNAAIENMTDEHPTKVDSMESFWMAETLKYFYLMFSEPDLISLDDYVFNTEAHPFRAPK